LRRRSLLNADAGNMIADVWTVMWKEWKELLVRRGSLRGGVLSLLIFVGVFGVFMPLSARWAQR